MMKPNAGLWLPSEDELHSQKLVSTTASVSENTPGQFHQVGGQSSLNGTATVVPIPSVALTCVKSSITLTTLSRFPRVERPRWIICRLYVSRAIWRRGIGSERFDFARQKSNDKIKCNRI